MSKLEALQFFGRMLRFRSRRRVICKKRRISMHIQNVIAAASHRVSGSSEARSGCSWETRKQYAPTSMQSKSRRRSQIGISLLSMVVTFAALLAMSALNIAPSMNLWTAFAVSAIATPVAKIIERSCMCVVGRLKGAV